MSIRGFILIIPLLYCVACVSSEPEADLRVVDWQPQSQMVVKQTNIEKPKFPVIDIHNHLGNLQRTEEYLGEMDKAGVWKCVSLDGRRPDDFYVEHLRVSQAVSKERFIVFGRIDFSTIEEPGWGEREAKKLEEAATMGIRGLKIHKTLGLGFRDKEGNLIRVDDPRIDPIWAKCGELGIPVLMHVTDPKAFYTPLDRYNERYDEIAGTPRYLLYGKDVPSKEETLVQRNRVMARHPNTIFIGAHVGNLAEELDQVGEWLDKYPNFYIDISARISELGRQPYTARNFMIKYQDRILFGTDTNPRAEAYRIYFRFLETDDEYFDPTRAHKLQGRWMIYGVFLPDEALEKIYNKNAQKILSMYAGPE